MTALVEPQQLGVRRLLTDGDDEPAVRGDAEATGDPLGVGVPDDLAEVAGRAQAGDRELGGAALGGDEEPVRLAVQAVLRQQLDLRFGDTDHFYPEIVRLLQEAAYQLQIRLQGPDVIDICFLAIAAVLASLTGNLEADNNGVSSGQADDACSPDSVPGQ